MTEAEVQRCALEMFRLRCDRGEEAAMAYWHDRTGMHADVEGLYMRLLEASRRVWNRAELELVPEGLVRRGVWVWRESSPRRR